jgi:indole-3-acetate monooxygenase
VGDRHDRRELTLEQRARIRAAGVWVTARSVAVVEAAYRSGGGSSIYVDCPLQRRLRDVHAVTQHFAVKPDTLTTAGAVLAGQDVTVPVSDLTTATVRPGPCLIGGRLGALSVRVR